MNHFNPFDFYIGVSAGAINITSYLTGQAGHSRALIDKVAFNPEFINVYRFLKGGHLLDLDWALREAKSELETIISKADFTSRPFYICMTDVLRGKAHYEISSADKILALLKASSALPLIYRDFPLINGIAMTDGGIADSLPVAKAIELGARKILVIRARPRHYKKKDSLMHRYIRWKLRKYRALHITLQQRVQQHRQTLELIRHPPPGIDIIEVCPPEHFRLGRLSQNPELLSMGYELGLQHAESALRTWQNG